MRLPLGGRITRRPAVLPLLVVALFATLALAAAYGAVPISPLTSAAILLNQTHVIHIQPSWPASDEAILLLYRLPRVVGAALVGAALGVAGVLFQGLLRNPLADPLLLGTSSGAALGATIAFSASRIYRILVRLRVDCVAGICGCAAGGRVGLSSGNA